MPISLCMIVKNEENNLSRCLESVKDIADEMIIVDTGSTDATVSIAESYHAKIFHYPWNGSFSDARNYSLQQAAGDWILVMDADDELEVSGKQAVLDLVRDSDADAYFFETLSFVGDKPGADVLKNMNLRLLRNGRGYFYSNPIHEQIYCNIMAVNPSAKIVNKDIKVYHYGYLNKNIREHDKRVRNINLLEKELREKPGYPFALFNLGSEYYAMGDNVKAIEYFLQAYRKFNPAEGFSSHLILKMVHCYMGLGKYDEALKISDEGLLYYPRFTDLVYMKGMICHTLGKYHQAVQHLKKCCDMGEAPNYLNVIIGAGSFRPRLLLGDIYYALEDYSAAAENYSSSLRENPDFDIAIPKLIRSYCEMKPPKSELEKNIEELRKYAPDRLDILASEELMQEKYYDLALSHMDRWEKKGGRTSRTQYYRGLCKLYLKKYASAYKILSPAAKDPEYGIQVVCMQALCRILEKKFTQAAKLLRAKHMEGENKKLLVYLAFNTVMETGEVTVLCDDELGSREYTPVIFEILKTLIRLHHFEDFEKALPLLNSVYDKTVLLSLGKLYYHENCYGLAYKELIRSIKIFDRIDIEGADMLHKLKYKGF